MCSILHRRQFRPWMWPDILFGLSEDGRRQNKLLSIIHGLTRDVSSSPAKEGLAFGVPLTEALRVL